MANDPLKLKEGCQPPPFTDLPVKEGFSPKFQWGTFVYLDDSDHLLGYRIFKMFKQMLTFIPESHQNRIEIIYKPPGASGTDVIEEESSLGWKWTPKPKRLSNK